MYDKNTHTRKGLEMTGGEVARVVRSVYDLIFQVFLRGFMLQFSNPMDHGSYRKLLRFEKVLKILLSILTKGEWASATLPPQELGEDGFSMVENILRENGFLFIQHDRDDARDPGAATMSVSVAALFLRRLEEENLLGDEAPSPK